MSIRQARLERLDRVRDLHMDGFTVREIADQLQQPRAWIKRDLSDLKARLQRKGERQALLGRVHALTNYERFQRTLWETIDTLKKGDEHKGIGAVARALADTQKAIDAMTERLRDELPQETELATIRDAVAEMDPDDLEARRQLLTDPNFEPPPEQLLPQFDPNASPQEDADDDSDSEATNDE